MIDPLNDQKPNSLNIFVDKFYTDEKEVSFNALNFNNSDKGCLSLLDTVLSTNNNQSLFGNLMREEGPSPIFDNIEDPMPVDFNA